MFKRDQFIPLKVGKRRFCGEPGLGFCPRSVGQKGDFSGNRLTHTAMLDRYTTLGGATGDIQFNPTIETPSFLPVSGGEGSCGKARFTGLAAKSLDTLPT